MIRTPMRLHQPESSAEAVALLTEHAGSVAVIGGGTWLLPQMGRGERSLEHLVSLGRLGLEPVSRTDEGFAIAATATYEDILADVELGAALPALRSAVAGITGGVGLRNVATAIGSACYANPSSDNPGLFVGLDARLRIAGPSGERLLDAADFFRGPFQTAVGDDELVLDCVVPAGVRRGAYMKVKTSGGGWPVATALAWRDDSRVGVVVGAVQAVPFAVDLSELVGSDGALALDAVSDRVASAVSQPWSDLLADGTYRARIAGPVARRAVVELEPAT